MKSGAGEDPFADVGDGDQEETDAVDGDSSDEPVPDERESQDVTIASARNGGEQQDADQDDRLDLPWVLERDGVKDDRPRTMEFRVRQETADQQRDFRGDVERILGKDVYALDLREAAYLVAMQHPEEVADVLRVWGYEYM